MSGDSDDAVDNLATAVRLEPDQPLFLAQLASALVSCKREADARRFMQRALEVGHDDVIATHAAGNLALHLGDLALAIVAFERAIELSPRFAVPHYNLGTARMQAGDLRDAASALQRAIELEPRLYQAHGNLGIVLRRQGHLEPAYCLLDCNTRLASLFTRTFPNVAVRSDAKHRGLAWVEANLPIDFQIYAGNLAQHYRGDFAAFPAQSYRLVADPVRVAKWRARHAALGPGLKIGISWRGGSTQQLRNRKSTALAQWRTLLAVKEVHFINLQYGKVRPEVEAVQATDGVTIHDWPDAQRFVDLEGVAAALRSTLSDPDSEKAKVERLV